MTSTRQIPARFLSATVALTGLTLLTAGCGSSTPKASTAATTPTAAAAAADPTESPYCQTARKWLVHEFNGDLGTVASDPVALKKYWTDYINFIATATRQAPAEIRADWPVGHDFLVKTVTPLLEKYDYDVERIKADGTTEEKAIVGRVEQGPNPQEQKAQDATHGYEGRVCQTSQPPAADVSFAGAKPNKAYCDAVQAGNESVRDVSDKKWSVDAVRTFVTSDDYVATYDKIKQSAPTEIKADVEADADWSTNQQRDVIEKYGYDARKLVLDGTAADRAIFQKSDPAVADHYARTVAYEEQVCSAE